MQELEVEDEETTAAEDDDHQEDYSMLPNLSIAASPRLIFVLIGSPFLGAMTEAEAGIHPTIDHWDPRNHVSQSLDKTAPIRDALQVTIDHLKDIIG